MLLLVPVDEKRVQGLQKRSWSLQELQKTCRVFYVFITVAQGS